MTSHSDADNGPPLDPDEDLGRHLATLTKYLHSAALKGIAPGREGDIYHGIIRGIKDPVFIETVDGAIVDVNPAACEMLGYTREELLAMDVAAIVPPETAAHLSRIVREETVRDGVHIEAEELRKDGTRIPVEVSCTLVTIDGETRVLAIARDIGRRKRAEGALRESERRYRSMFDNSPVSLWEEDLSAVRERVEEMKASGIRDIREHLRRDPGEVTRCATLVKVLAVNRATLDLFGAARVEDFHGNIGTLFSAETEKSFTEEIIAISEGRRSFKCRTAVMTLTGEKKEVVIHWTVMPGSEESYANVLVSVVDIA